jgi:tetratricopeptide (TPR) repeat protein
LFWGGILVAKKRTPAPAQLSPAPLSSQDQVQEQLKNLLKQQKYRQALEAIHKAQRSQPDLVFTPSEAEIWLLRGKQEFQKSDFKQADTSLRRSLQLGLQGEAHYWLAKTLLSMNRLDTALPLIQAAFEDGSLPKEYSICYPKLLLLKGETATVEQLLSKQAKRFPAAQQQWLRGVLALQSQQSAAALVEFQKIKRPVTPGDRPDIWQIYTQQTLQQWEEAASKLGLGRTIATLMGFPLSRPTYTEHPLLQRLALLQKLTTGHPSLKEMSLTPNSGLSEETLDVLSILELLDENNPHDAAHALLRLDRHSKKYPELAALRPSLLALAGEQSMMQGEMGCAAEFWGRLHREETAFNPQLAVNLMKVLDANEDDQDLQRLITQIIKWLEQDLKQHPQNWTPDRQREALVYGHCRLADTWMTLGKPRAAMGELGIAERLDARSPEVIGRHGLIAFSEKNYEEATRLLTQALEGGCRSAPIYMMLLETWKKLGNSEAAAETRRRFGKKFGDMNAETEVTLPPWVDALSTQDYSLFCHLIQEGSDRDPAIRACQLFIDATEGEPTASGKISLKQRLAVLQWEALLKELSPQQQVPTLQAIALAIHLFAKRDKGIAALLTQYMLKLFELGEQQPEARAAHILILALKEKDPKKLQVPLQAYLSSQPQPGNALAQIQLQLHLYTQTIIQDQMLRSFIETALQREPQNPLLLLAKATTYPANSSNYDQLKQQGFELARRLQDTKALQAFRQEEAFLNTRMTQELLPSAEAFGSFDLDDVDEFMENMIRKMFGNKIPPDQLEKMMPQFKQMMMNDLPPGDDDDDDDDEDEGFGFPFGALPPGRPTRRSPNRSPNRKRK